MSVPKHFTCELCGDVGPPMDEVLPPCFLCSTCGLIAGYQCDELDLIDVVDRLNVEVKRLTEENEKLKREVDTAEKQSLDFYVEKENAALKDSIKEITITVDDCCEINAQHYSHDQAIEQDYALSTIRQELLKIKDKGSDV